MENDQIVEKRDGDDESDQSYESEQNEAFHKEDLHCRYFRNEWPEKGELVMVEISNVNEEGAYVQLLEYNNREGLIQAASVAKGRIKNVKKYLKLGQQEAMQVENVDRCFIDLSKKHVQVQDAEAKKVEFNKSKVVHLVMKLTAFTLQRKTIDLYEEFGWDLYDSFAHAYDAFKLCLTDPELVWDKINITEEQKKALLINIAKKMAAKPIKLRSSFNLQCYTYEGIEAIREALLEAKKQTKSDKFNLVYQLISPPQYVVEVITLDKVGGTEALEQAVLIVQAEIKKRGGIFKLVHGPTRIGSKDDGVERDDIIAGINQNEDESSGEESNEEGMKIDLENDDIQVEEEEEEKQTA